MERATGFHMNAQGELNFDAADAGEGYAGLAGGAQAGGGGIGSPRPNLPLLHQVEVWLVGGIRLRGKLQLQEEMLVIEEDHVRHLELRGGSCTPHAEMKWNPVIRLD